MRAVARIEPVDVERDPDLVGEGLRDLARDRREPLAVEAPARDVAIEEDADAFAERTDVIDLLFAYVADADLNDLRDRAHVLEDVVHDRRVRVSEAFVRLARVGVRVEVENAERSI